MIGGGGDSPPAQAQPTDSSVFELERFAWAAPDRLEVSGRFAGIEATPPAEAILVVHGEAGVHRLPAVAGSGSGDGWTASFAWTQTPVAFERAELELGSDLVVELPRPGVRRLLRRSPLRVRRIAAAESPNEKAGAPHEAAADGVPAGDVPGTGAFRARLDGFRAAAEQAAAEGVRAADRLDAGLREAGEAIAARDAAIAQLRSELEQSRQEAGRLRAELDRQRRKAELAGAEITAARDALGAARADAERLLGRLAQAPEAPGAGG